MSRILIFSARMGAGHDGAARELARRAEERGHQAEIVDFLDAFWRPLARVWAWFYYLQLRRWPESYESSYQLFYRYPAMWKPFVMFERLLAGRRTQRWIRVRRPDVIVSTYSFATLVLGQLRQEHKIDVPLVAFLTDFGVHPRTVHPAVDLHLAVHPLPAAHARRYVPGPVEAPGPAVDPAFWRDRPSPVEATARLGFSRDEIVVLVVSGSWGVGTHLIDVVRALVHDGRFHVVTCCGRQAELKARLESEGLGTVLGWTDSMATYMAASAVVVENAGGLSSLEAFASHVPVVTFDAIPGHGRDNARTMVEAGVTTCPSTYEELCDVVAKLAADSSDRHCQIAAADAMFAGDPIEPILRLAHERPSP